MNIGELILEYRSKHKLSQRQFAKKCGDISNGYISMLENNVNPATNKGITPTIDKLKLIANGMDMNLDDLFRLVDDMPVSLASDTEPTKQPVLSDRALKVARAYDQMSGYGKAIIDAIITQENLHKHIFIANVRNDLVLDGTGRWEVKASAISEQCEPETDDDFSYSGKQESDVRVLE